MRELRFHDLLQPMYFATTVDTSATSPVLDAHHRAKWTDRARAPLVKITSSCLFVDSGPNSMSPTALSSCRFSILASCSKVMTSSRTRSLCCFGSWVRRSLDVVANALDQESLLGAACPWVGWRVVSSMCDGLTSGSHWDLTPASQSAASSSSKPQSCQGSSFTGANADSAATPSLSPAP